MSWFHFNSTFFRFTYFLTHINSFIIVLCFPFIFFNFKKLLNLGEFLIFAHFFQFNILFSHINLFVFIDFFTFTLGKALLAAFN